MEIALSILLLLGALGAVCALDKRPVNDLYAQDQETEDKHG